MLILLVYFIIFFTVIIYFGYFNYNENTAISKEAKIASVNVQMEALTEKLQSDMDNTYIIANNVVEGKEEPHQIEQDIEQYFELRTDITGITRYTVDGTTISHRNSYSPYDFNGCSQSFAKEIMGLGDENSKDFALIPGRGNEAESFLGIKFTNLSTEAHTNGVIILEINNASIKSWLNGFATQTEGTIIMTDPLGNTLFTTNEQTIPATVNINDIREGFEEGGTDFSEGKIDDQDFRLFVSQSEYFSVYWFMPTEVIEMSSVARRNFMLFSVIIGILVIGVTFLFFKKTIYNPIKRFEKALQSMVQGEFDNKVYIGGGHDLYVLSDSLNSLIKRLKDLIDREYNAKVLKKQAEFNALQSQINPHFLYNTLESIRGQALCEGVDNIAHMTKALSNLFKYIISYKENLVSFNKELKSIENYILIQQFRFDNRFDIIFKIDEDTLEYKLPKLTIQPIIENAITHGYETKMGRGTIILRAYRTEKRLVISIEDDGIGISEDKLDKINQELLRNTNMNEDDRFAKRSSIGLVNVNERIRLYFDDRYGIRVYSTLNLGTKVEVIVPLLKDDNR